MLLFLYLYMTGCSPRINSSALSLESRRTSAGASGLCFIVKMEIKKSPSLQVRRA